MAFSALLCEKLGSLPYFSLLPARLLLPRQVIEPFFGEANSQVVTFGDLPLKKLAHCLIPPCSKSHLCTTPPPPQSLSLLKATFCESSCKQSRTCI